MSESGFGGEGDHAEANLRLGGQYESGQQGGVGRWGLGAFVLLYGPEQLARVEEEVHLNYMHVQSLCICMYTTQLGTLVQLASFCCQIRSSHFTVEHHRTEE